ncbi:hypothetical protein [Tolypothrix sp. NIES-4075]|uniref:hypothetical protein n=1 Tax=Tolypothrix sp. NIES-4075 TaxID=2005459 RepID=UPI000B5C96C4|nr:hypothetical protein [Tolypothrix sp. NIES-4075]
MGNGEWVMGKGKELLPITPSGFARCVTVGRPAQRTGSPILNYQLPIPHAQYPISNRFLE